MFKPRILIVEDEAVTRMILDEDLRELGYEIAGEAAGGAEAVALAAQTDPDLVLMDIIMQGPMDGIEAAQQIHDRFRIPVVYLTAHSDSATLQRARITEPYGYVVKPYVRKDLHANIEMALYKRKMEHSLEEKEQALEYQAQHDSLTGLPNRLLLTDRIRQAIYQAERSTTQVAILFLDLDRFKQLNDTQGHQAGDQFLQALARRLEASCRRGDTVARFGGDEFVLVFGNLEQAADLEPLLARLVEALREPVHVGTQEVRMTASIGISLYPQDGNEGELLLRNADTAMYRAKEVGRNNFQYYTEELNVRLVERTTLQHELHRAIEANQFVLHYQPQVDLSSGRIVATEALIRWQHPRLGHTAPARFIPLAEETGLIIPIGEWVLRQACRQMQEWHQAGLRRLRVAVNLSVRELESEDFEQRLQAILADTGLPAEFLEIELTETEIMRHPEEMVGRLQRLRNIGVTLALDDFGVGYSSLSYLKRFSFDRLKIDQSFVGNITDDPEDAAITRTIIAIAKSLGMGVIAEGVEKKCVLAYLWNQGCNDIQGFYVGKPLPAEAARTLLWQNLGEPFRFDLPTQEAEALLLVDDEPNVTRAIARSLAGEGYRILSANSAADAFELLALHRVGVIICDQRMPEMSGIDFLSRVREMYPEAVRIMLTASIEARTISDAVNRGAIFKLHHKPWDAALLRRDVAAAFEELARRRKTSSPAA